MSDTADRHAGPLYLSSAGWPEASPEQILAAVPRHAPAVRGFPNSRDMPFERELELIEGAKAVQGYVLL